MILSRIRILPQERFDLEDLNGMLSASRTDSKNNIKKIMSNLNYVINGFTVTGIGLKSATVNMSNGTLIIPQNTSDFSWYTTAPSEPNITIPDADLIDGVRNYVEISLLTENNTSVTRAFWDPEANGGAGLEFNQIVDTITDLKVEFIVSTGGFSGNPDRLPLCMIDTDNTGTIKAILDERILFHRLGKPSDPHNQFAMGTRTEPPYVLTMTSASGVFVTGETITIGSETAKVFSGGTSSISFQLPSSKNFFPGDSVTGGTSGATGIVATVAEAFTGVDKTVKNLKEDLDAIKTEILLIKNPSGFWWSSTESIVDLRNSIDDIDDLLNSPSYDEDYVIGAPITSGASITIPVNSRVAGTPQQFYTVGAGALEVFLNGQRLSQNVSGGWSESGISGSPSSAIIINQNLQVADLLEFRLGFGGAGNIGGGSGSGSLQDAYDQGNTISTDTQPFTVGGTAPKVAQFNGDIGVTGVIDPKGITFIPQSSTPLEPSDYGLWVDNSGNLMQDRPSQSPLNITQGVISGGGGSANIDRFTLDSTDITNKFVTLSGTPSTNSDTILDVIGGMIQDYGVDFIVSGDMLSWDGYDLEDILEVGDKLIVQFD